MFSYTGNSDSKEHIPDIVLSQLKAKTISGETRHGLVSKYIEGNPLEHSSSYTAQNRMFLEWILYQLNQPNNNLVAKVSDPVLSGGSLYTPKNNKAYATLLNKSRTPLKSNYPIRITTKSPILGVTTQDSKRTEYIGNANNGKGPVELPCYIESYDNGLMVVRPDYDKLTKQQLQQISLNELLDAEHQKDGKDIANLADIAEAEEYSKLAGIKPKGKRILSDNKITLFDIVKAEKDIRITLRADDVVKINGYLLPSYFTN